MRDSHRMNDGIDLHLDNRQIAAFVIASLVVLGAVFSVGVLVGKQLASAAQGGAGGKPGDALAAIDEKEKMRALDSVQGVGEIPTPKPASKPDALTFQQELTKPSTASPAIEPTKRPSPTKLDEKPKAAEPASQEAAKPEKPAAAPAKAEADSKKEEAAKKKETLSAAFDKAAKADEEQESGGGAAGFTLQVASLPTEEEAQKLVSRLTAKGLKPTIVEADVAGKGHVYRVRSGSYSTRADAEEGLKAFKKKSALPAIIIGK